MALAEENPNLVDAELVARIKKVLQASEKRGGNKLQVTFEEKWLYDDNVAMKICTKNFVVMKGEMGGVGCPLCMAKAEAEYAGQLCGVCMTCELGKVTLGKKIMD